MRAFRTAIRGVGASTNSASALHPIIDINLLPRDRRPVDVAPSTIAAGALLVLCIAAMAPLGVRVHNARAAASVMEQQVADAERGVKAVQLSLARQRGLAGELEAAKTKLAGLQSEREGMQGGRRPLEDDLLLLFGYGAFVPKGVSVTSVAGAPGSLTVGGVAPDPLDAIAYAETLVKSGGFASAQLSSFAPAATDVGRFTVEVAR